MKETIGALVLGANLNGLSIARSLGRQGVPVWMVTPPNIKLASFSRYVQRSLPWPEGDVESQVSYLMGLARRHDVEGWVLFPTSDESAALLAKFHVVLSRSFRVSTPPWEALSWAYDKRLTYKLAAEQQVDYPFTLNPCGEADLQDAPLDFPAIIKPATHTVASRLTTDKAWRVANRGELLSKYREAVAMISPDEILLQEMIPGAGEAQFSYAALCLDGHPIACLTARRSRQYPIDFGYSSSFVETLPVPQIVEPSRRLLNAIRYTGLVEVEYKFDARNGRYKLLDINPRLWTWSPLGAKAGVDFPYLLWKMVLSRPVPQLTARPGVRWVRMSTDVPAAIHEILRGRWKLTDYLRILAGPIQFALMASDDPLPGLLDLPLFAYKHLYNRYKAFRDGLPARPERLKD